MVGQVNVSLILYFSILPAIAVPSSHPPPFKLAVAVTFAGRDVAVVATTYLMPSGFVKSLDSFQDVGPVEADRGVAILVD